VAVALIFCESGVGDGGGIDGSEGDGDGGSKGEGSSEARGGACDGGGEVKLDRFA